MVAAGVNGHRRYAPPPPATGNGRAGTDVRVLPHDLAAERAVCGSVLLGPEIYSDVAAALPQGAAEFFSERYAEVFRAVGETLAAGEPVDGVFLRERLTTSLRLDDADAYMLLEECLGGVGSYLRGREYARRVHAHYKARETAAAALEVARAAYDGGDMQAAIDLLESLREAPKADAPDAREVLDAIVEASDTNQPIVQTIKTGIGIIDDGCGGAVRGEFVGVVAGPGVGKTIFVDKATISALSLNPDATAVVFNIETATKVRMARIVCGQAFRLGDDNTVKRCVSLSALLKGELGPVWQASVRAAASELVPIIGGGRLTFIDDVSVPEEIARIIRSRKPSIVVIDHIGLLEIDPGRGSSIEATDSALRVINDAIKEAGCAAFLVNEINKNALASGDTDLSAVRGTARFNSLAGMSITIASDPSIQDKDPFLHLQLRKARHGRKGIYQVARLFGGLGHMAIAEPISGIEPTEPKRTRRPKAAANG